MLRGKTPQGSSATVVSAQCPSGLDATVGAYFDCHVRLSDDRVGVWRVLIVGSNGQVTVQPTGFDTNILTPGPSEVGQAKIVQADGGVTLKVTPLTYIANVGESSGDPGSHIAGIRLKITNVGSRLYRDGKPGRLSELRLDTGMLGTPPHRVEHAPCGGSFYRTPVRIAPGATSEGCIPYEVPDGAQAHFFSFAPDTQPTTNWSLG